MEDDRLKEFLTQLQDAFTSAQLEKTTEFFAFPVVVYSIAGVTVLRTQDELLERTSNYRAALDAMGVVSSTFEIVDSDPPSNDRTKVTVRVTNFTEDGSSIAGSLIRYFLLDKEGTFRIEMMEYLEIPLDAAEVEKIVH